MDITILYDLVKNLGVPIAGCVLLFYLVIHWSNVAEKRLFIWLDKVTDILLQQAETVKETSTTIKLMAATEERICTMATEILALVREHDKA